MNVFQIVAVVSAILFNYQQTVFQVPATLPPETCQRWYAIRTDTAMTLREETICALSGENWEAHPFYGDRVTHQFLMQEPIKNRADAYDEITRMIALLPDYPPVELPHGVSAIIVFSWDQELLPARYTFGYGVWIRYADAIMAYENGLRGEALVNTLEITLPDG